MIPLRHHHQATRSWLLGTCVALLAALQPAPRAQTTVTWSATNPGGGGAFSAVAMGPTDLIVAASDLSGAYRSLDGGQSWDILGFTRGVTITHIAAVELDDNDPNLVLLGGDGGLFRSADLGDSFTQTVANGFIESIVVSNQRTGMVPSASYATWHSDFDEADARVLRSYDGGQSWAPVDIDLPRNLRGIKLLVAPDDFNTVYLLSGYARFASGPVAVYRSTNGGANWTQIDTGLPARAVDIAIDRTDPKALWLSVDPAQPNQLGSIYRSVDRGTTWAPAGQRSGILWPGTQPGQLRTMDPLHQFPWDLQRDSFWLTTDYGRNWAKQSVSDQWQLGWSKAHFAKIGGVSSVCNSGGFHPRNPNAFCWVTGQFIYLTLDGGKSVRKLHTIEATPGRYLSTGFDNVVPLDLSWSAADPDRIYAGYFDIGLWRSEDGGNSWASCNQAAFTGNWIGYGGNTTTILTDPTRALVAWAPQAEDVDLPHALLKTTDGGQTWTHVGTNLPSPIADLALANSSPASNRTLLCIASGDVFRSFDDGGTWQLVLPGKSCGAVAIDPFDARIMYAGGVDGMWRSLDNGMVWTEVGTPAMRGNLPSAPWDPEFVGIFDIAVSAVNRGEVWITRFGPGGAGGLYKSATNGDVGSWQQVLIDDWSRRVAVSTTRGNVVVVTSSEVYYSGGDPRRSRGVLRSEDGGRTFQPQTAGMPWPFALPIALHPTDDTRMLTGSPGIGILRTIRNDRIESYGIACTGITSTTPTMFGRGRPTIGTTMDLGVAATPPNASGAMLLGAASASLPVGGCTLHVAQPVQIGLRSNASGTSVLPLPIPLNPWLVGRAVYCSAVIVDPQSPNGVATFANGLKLTVGD